MSNTGTPTKKIEMIRTGGPVTYRVNREDGAQALVWYDRSERAYTTYIVDENGWQDGPSFLTPDKEQAIRLAEKVERYA